MLIAFKLSMMCMKMNIANEMDNLHFLVPLGRRCLRCSWGTLRCGLLPFRKRHSSTSVEPPLVAAGVELRPNSPERSEYLPRFAVRLVINREQSSCPTPKNFTPLNSSHHTPLLHDVVQSCNMACEQLCKALTDACFPKCKRTQVGAAISNLNGRFE